MEDRPVIRVEDNDASPPLTLRYICGANELDVTTILADTHSLLTHPGRARYESRNPELMECSEDFLDTFWSCAASLLDYFADFFATDTSLMQSVWFHLLDIWQKASPLDMYQGDSLFRHDHTTKSFKQDYDDTLDLIHRLLFAKPPPSRDEHTQSIIHNPSGFVNGPAGEYNVGAYVSGLKPWQQFLYAGSPGFRPLTTAHAQSTTTSSDSAMCTSTNCTTPTPPPQTIQYLPHAALALLSAHTTRLLTHTLALSPSTPTSSTLAHFQATTLPIPSSPAHPYTTPAYFPPGTVLTHTLHHGAPPIRRYEGFADLSLIVERPDLVLLDEVVGMCRGREAYVSMTGVLGGEGVGWDVWEIRREGEGKRKGVWEMFDEWEV